MKWTVRVTKTWEYEVEAGSREEAADQIYEQIAVDGEDVEDWHVITARPGWTAGQMKRKHRAETAR